MYHFLSGYTARVAGTEKGVTEPEATFSTCFGAPFMPRHPTVYAKMLGEKMARQNVKWLAGQKGWSGGGFGVGERMAIRHTRAMVRAALDGRLAAAASSDRSALRHAGAEACPDVPGEVLNPRIHGRTRRPMTAPRAMSPGASRRTPGSSRPRRPAR